MGKYIAIFFSILFQILKYTFNLIEYCLDTLYTVIKDYIRKRKQQTFSISPSRKVFLTKNKYHKKLTTEEFLYCLLKRKQANLLFGLGTIDREPYLIILPDYYANTKIDYKFSPSGLYLTSNNITKSIKEFIQEQTLFRIYKTEAFCTNRYNNEDKNKMEKKGILFLPLIANGNGPEHICFTDSEETIIYLRGFRILWIRKIRKHTDRQYISIFEQKCSVGAMYW